MARRRLRLSSWSSDESEEQEEPPPHDLSPTSVQSVVPDTLNSHINPIVSETLQVSDDDEEEQDFIDVSDHLSPPSPDSDHLSPPSSSCPVNDFLGGLGLRVKREWLDACIRALEASSCPGFFSLSPSEKGKMCLEHFLVSDMNYSGAGVLPPNLHSMHLLHLPGPYVLQVDEIVNITCPLKSRYQAAPPTIKRCLKVSMTDGVQRVFGLEYKPIKDLQLPSPAGFKVLISNATVRHGLLMLLPQTFQLLGGVVDQLEAARQRLLTELDKPPRGRRTRTGVLPPLASRATNAAWPLDTVQQSEPSSTSVGTEPSRSDHGVGMFHRGNEAFAASVGEAFAAPFVEAFSTPVSRTNANSELSSNFVSNEEEILLHSSVHSSGASAEPTVVSNSVEDINMVNSVEDINMVNLEEDNNMVDVEHPLILSGDREFPFTYLASLSAKWAASKEKSSSVRGKIKCFLTGVKGFQFNQRTTYELHVYVDDGSLISEVLIDHEAVQKMIGHSPKDATDALASSDVKVVSGMKEILRQFQVFLVNFEGTMLVEMNRASSLPVVIEMEEGCLESDAWLLLRRLNGSNAVESEDHTHMDPIDISP